MKKASLKPSKTFTLLQQCCKMNESFKGVWGIFYKKSLNSLHLPWKFALKINVLYTSDNTSTTATNAPASPQFHTVGRQRTSASVPLAKLILSYSSLFFNPFYPLYSCSSDFCRMAFKYHVEVEVKVVSKFTTHAVWMAKNYIKNFSN